MTLARFPKAIEAFAERVKKLSDTISLPPYTVDSLTLLTGNAILYKPNILHTWQLQ